MTSAAAERILARLGIVEHERERRSADPALRARVGAIKAFQQRRFAFTYADLSRTERYGAVVAFFLDELYGPKDFTQRDAQFARVVPGMVRLFPADVVDAVATLAELHALSEVLDTQMGAVAGNAPVDAPRYIQAWGRVGRSDQRATQVTLTVEVARRLNELTRKPLLRGSLRLMRAPARAAGLSELQRFLESGFDTFRAMGGAAEFITLVESRERALAQTLYSAGATAHDGGAAWDAALHVLPP